MTGREKISLLESVCSYLLERIDEKSIDEHWQPIYNAQTKDSKNKDYTIIVENLFEWAWEDIRGV